MMRFIPALYLLALAACGAGDTDPGGAPSDSGAEAPGSDGATSPELADAGEWPAPGAPVRLRRERSVDLTGDGAAEIVSVTARGVRLDSLDVALTITRAAGDTLWHDAWPSLHYFKYDMREGKADSTISRIVRSHVDSLLAEDRFSSRGLPERLSQGDGTAEMMREVVRYHLAELDWRRQADLTPADDTPPDAHSRIDPQIVAPERVSAVVAELRERPSFWYFAGGEETYAIAWSDREQAFVRLYSCC